MRYEGFGNLSKSLAWTEGRRNFWRKDWKRGEMWLPEGSTHEGNPKWFKVSSRDISCMMCSDQHLFPHTKLPWYLYYLAKLSRLDIWDLGVWLSTAKPSLNMSTGRAEATKVHMLQSATETFLLCCNCCIMYAMKLLFLSMHWAGWPLPYLLRYTVCQEPCSLLEVEMLIIATQYPFSNSSIKTELNIYFEWQYNQPSTTFSSLLFHKVWAWDYITAYKTYTGVRCGTSTNVT